MGTPMTAMRDPVFYAFHAYINDIFLEHKDLLAAYTTTQVIFTFLIPCHLHNRIT